MRDDLAHLSNPAETEASETAMRELVGRVHEAAETPSEAYRPVFDDLTRRAAEAIGVKSADWIRTELPDGPVEQAVANFWKAQDDPDALLAEPHLLGWFHQHYGEPKRAESNRAHNARESKHDSSTVTTQLYTPRWIADVVVRGALEAAGVDRPTLLDPAVGGGQMLMAGWDAVERREPDADPLAIARRLRGCDIDARAVEAARRGLKLLVARRLGRRAPDVEETIDRNIRPADGLFGDVSAEDIVVTNPPYMGSRSMPADLKTRVREAFEPYHGDLYAAFIRRCHELADASVGILAQQTIWYLKRFRKARRDLLDRGHLALFVHLGPHAFATLSGEKANVVAFAQKTGSQGESDGETVFVDLRDVGNPADKRKALLDQVRGSSSDRVTRLHVDRLAILPGRPVSYWLPKPLRRHFDGGRRLADIAEIPGSQHKTAANRTYVKKWWEVDDPSLLHRPPMQVSPDDAPATCPPENGERWIFYSKGGRYSPWWGNWEHVVDWSASAREYYDTNATSNLLAEEYRFRQGICYTDFGGQSFNARWMPPGCLFDMAGPAIFPKTDGVEAPGERLFALLGVLNSTPVRMLLNALNPSIHYQVTDLRRLPVPEWSPETERSLARRARELVSACRRREADEEKSPVARDTGGLVLDAEEIERREREIDEIVMAEIYGFTE